MGLGRDGDGAAHALDLGGLLVQAQLVHRRARVEDPGRPAPGARP